MAFDAERAYGHVKNLSFPRLIGTPGEKKAREYVEGFFRGLGLEVETQRFRYTTSAWDFALRLALLLQSGLVILAARVFHGHAFVSAFISAVILGGTSLMSRWGGLFETFDREGAWETANIIARPGSKSPAPRKPGAPTVIFMAHYDTKSQTFPLPLRYVLFASGFLLTLGLSLSMIVLAFTSARPDILRWALATAVPNVLLLFNRTTNESNGAVDNASGVGVLLELARMMTEENPPSLSSPDFMYVSTGAEEVGMLGAVRFIRKFGPALDPKNTYLVNLDGPGAKGNVVVITAFGMPRNRTCRRLQSLAREILNGTGRRWHDSTLPIGAGLDTLPIAAHGYEAISIASGSLSWSVFSIHSKHDTIGNVDPESLRRCGELAAGIARKI